MAELALRKEAHTTRTDEIIYREDLYPRIHHDPVTVQKYASDLSVLPPIEINQNNELIDGWHRWTAHKKNEVEQIAVVVTRTKSGAHFLELAIEKNAVHGLQLSQADKKRMARQVYHVTDSRDRATKKKRLAKILSVSERTVNGWLSRIDKDAKAERNQKIFDLWMRCYTRDYIAASVSVSDGEVSAITSKMATLPNLTKPAQNAANHETDFDIPVYNVWKRRGKTKHYR